MILLWFAVPIALISLPTSKLYYYAYPFLPPVGLGGRLSGGAWLAVSSRVAPRAIVAIDELADSAGGPSWWPRPATAGRCDRLSRDSPRLRASL